VKLLDVKTAKLKKIAKKAEEEKKKKSWHIPEPYGKMMAELGLENFTILMEARPQMVTKTMVITITNLQSITHLE
jgi:hypothetical protein